MVFIAALLAARPNSSRNAPGMAFPAWTTQPPVRLKPVHWKLFASVIPAGIVDVLHAGNLSDEFGAFAFLPSRIPSSTRDHASCPFRRPAARRRSASTASPLRGLGSSQNKFESCGKGRRSNFFRAPPRKHSLALGSRATRSLREG